MECGRDMEHSSRNTIIEWHNGNVTDWRYERTYELYAFSQQDQLKLHRRNMLVQQMKATDQQAFQMNSVNILSFNSVYFLRGYFGTSFSCSYITHVYAFFSQRSWYIFWIANNIQWYSNDCINALYYFSKQTQILQDV